MAVEWHTANAVYAVRVAAVGGLPSATVGEDFAVCQGHTTNHRIPVVQRADDYWLFKFNREKQKQLQSCLIHGENNNIWCSGV